MADPVVVKYSPDDKWDAIVSRSGGQIFASSRYLDVIRAQFENARECHLALLEKDRLKAVMPLFILRPERMAPIANSSPFFGSHGGVYAAEGADERECVRILLAEYMRLCEREGCLTSTVIEPLGNGYGDLYDSVLQPWKKDRRTGQILNHLSADYDEMMSRYSSAKRRNNIRKAEKSGVVVRTRATPGTLQRLCALHWANAQRIGVPAKTERFFDAVRSVLAAEREWAVYEAEYDDRIIASLLVLFFGDCAEYFVPESLQEYRSLQAMSLVVHNAILDAAARGMKRFNFGGTGANAEGVYKFKRQWGATDVEYRYYVNKYCPGRQFEALTGSTDRELYKGFYLFPFGS